MQTFPVTVRTHGVDIAPRHRDLVARRIGAKLHNFARRVLEVAVNFEDLNGPRGGDDTVCRIRVALRGLPTVIAAQTAGDPLAAMDLAAERAEHAVRHAIDRSRG